MMTVVLPETEITEFVVMFAKSSTSTKGCKMDIESKVGDNNRQSINILKFPLYSLVFSLIIMYILPSTIHLTLIYDIDPLINYFASYYRYQPVNVYEIVMPPNEIRVFPVKVKNSKSESTRMLTMKKPTAASDMNTNDLEDGYCTDSTDHTTATATKSHSQSNHHKVTNLQKTSHLPSYLYAEASDVLTK